MASPSRKPNPSVNIEERLRQRPGDFSFYQAVRLLQRMAGNPVGRFSDPSTEAVRFKSHATLAFPATEIQSLEVEPESAPAMRTNFFGLIGPVGVLPTHLTAFLIERLRAEDRTAFEFLDILHHRFVSLLYRAWEKHHFEVAYERGDDDSLSPHLMDLLGLGTNGLAGRQCIPDAALISYVGLLSQFPRSPAVLQQIVADYFEVPVEIQPFAGRWRKLDPNNWTRLDAGQKSDELGRGTVLGDEVWDQQSFVRIRIGPVPLATYERFLPDGDAYEPLRALQRFICGEDIDVEVQLVLARDEAPRLELDADGPGTARLGWISWMFTRPLDRDPDETTFPL